MGGLRPFYTQCKSVVTSIVSNKGRFFLSSAAYCVNTSILTRKMGIAAEMREYLTTGGATNNDIDRFVEFIDVFDDLGKPGRYGI